MSEHPWNCMYCGQPMYSTVALEDDQKACGSCASMMQKIAALESEVEGLREEIVDWQCATGLMRGGDPDGVDQKMLAAFINDATSIIGAVSNRTVVHWGALEALVEKFNQRWPEE